MRDQGRGARARRSTLRRADGGDLSPASGARRVDGTRSESGAVLILALVYIVAISLIVGALARWATNDLNNTNNFGTTNQLHIAETSAMNTAIESIRYTPWPSGTGGTNGAGETVLPTTSVATGWGWCFQPLTSPVTSPATPGSTVSSIPMGAFTIDLYCSTVENNSYATNPYTRTVTLIACPSTTSATSCEASPLLTAVVGFDDYPEGGGIYLATQCNVQGVVCGSGQTLISWIWL